MIGVKSWKQFPARVEAREAHAKAPKPTREEMLEQDRRNREQLARDSRR